MYVSYDPGARATYVQLKDEPVAETVEVGDRMMVDVNEHHEPVGVEFLVLPNAISQQMLARLADAFPALKELAETDRWLLPATRPVVPA